MTTRKSDDSISALDLGALAARLQSRELLAVDVLEAQLARIAACNPSLNAVVSMDIAAARQRAEAADVALQRGETWGPLHGVPVTLKDGHEVAGLRTTMGTPVFDRVATEDGAVAARLRSAGAILLGHTNVPAFLADYQTHNAIFGRTNNPWNLARTPGGSSGGAAAAVAAGLSPVEVGSDLGHSVRLPASFCGIYGLKATEHRVSLRGFFRQPEGVPQSVRIMSSLGPMARSLDDLELVLRLIAGPSAGESEVPPVALPPRRESTLRGLRLAVVPTLPGVPVSRTMRQRIERFAARASDAGARVSDRLPDLDWEETTKLFVDLIGTITGLFNPGAELRDEQRTLAWYFGALSCRDRLIADWQSYFDDVDALILPAALGGAFEHAESSAEIDIDGQPVSYLEHSRLGFFCNLTGLPALAAPIGLDEARLPLGVQLVGPLWSEIRLLEIARALETAKILPGFEPPPIVAG